MSSRKYVRGKQLLINTEKGGWGFDFCLEGKVKEEIKNNNYKSCQKSKNISKNTTTTTTTESFDILSKKTIQDICKNQFGYYSQT